MKSLWLCMMFLGLAIVANAAIVGPYQPDAYTLQLWHLDELALPCLNSIASGPNLNNLGLPGAINTTSFTGFGKGFYNSAAGGWVAPKPAANGSGDNVAMKYMGTGGALTFEAIVRIDFDPTLSIYSAGMQIFSGESEGSEPRTFQFRILAKSTTHTTIDLVFLNLNPVVQFAAAIPETGPDAIVQGGWYHIAATRDAASNVKLYWTKMDASRTQANLIGSGTLASLPNNSTIDFVIGNEGRDHNGRTEGFVGMIDEVRISSVARPAAGMMFAATANPRASSPTPACFAADVPKTQVLQWTKGASGDTAQYFYITDKLLPSTTDPNFKGVTSINVTGLSQYSPALASDKTYHWAISNVLSEPNGMTDAVVWKFDSVKSSPNITVQPVDVFAASGTANFTIAIQSETTAIYTWYKTPDFSNSTPTGDTVVGGNSATLSLPVSMANEGFYYCKVNNASGIPVYSNVVRLVMTRTMAYWTLNDKNGGVYTDSSTEGHNATIIGDPNIVAGVKGNAAQINAVRGAANAGTWNPSAVSNQVTVSCWVKWDGAASGNQAILSKANNWQNPGVCWELACGSAGNIFFLGGSGNPGLAGTTLKVGEWQYIAVSYDGTRATLYSTPANDTGVMFVTNSGAVTLGQGVDSTVWIGARGSDATTPAEQFTGLLDEVKIFNSAKTGPEIVALYNEVFTRTLCGGVYPGQYDFNKNCKIDMGDFAMFASNWLTCGIYPASNCQ